MADIWENILNIPKGLAGGLNEIAMAYYDPDYQNRAKRQEMNQQITQMISLYQSTKDPAAQQVILQQIGEKLGRDLVKDIETLKSRLPEPKKDTLDLLRLQQIEESKQRMKTGAAEQQRGRTERRGEAMADVYDYLAELGPKKGISPENKLLLAQQKYGQLSPYLAGPAQLPSTFSFLEQQPELTATERIRNENLKRYDILERLGANRNPQENDEFYALRKELKGIPTPTEKEEKKLDIETKKESLGYVKETHPLMVTGKKLDIEAKTISNKINNLKAQGKLPPGDEFMVDLRKSVKAIEDGLDPYTVFMRIAAEYPALDSELKTILLSREDASSLLKLVEALTGAK